MRQAGHIGSGRSPARSLQVSVMFWRNPGKALDFPMHGVSGSSAKIQMDVLSSIGYQQLLFQSYSTLLIEMIHEC